MEEAEKYPPDICFMDIQMPGLSGIQAIREIQKFNRSVVFVIITAYDKFNYAKEAVNLGVMEFLTKPVNKKVILEICSKAMEKVDSTRQKRSDDLRIREKLETVVPMIESDISIIFFCRMIFRHIRIITGSFWISGKNMDI